MPDMAANPPEATTTLLMKGCSRTSTGVGVASGVGVGVSSGAGVVAGEGLGEGEGAGALGVP